MPLYTARQDEWLADFTKASRGSPEAYRTGVDNAIAKAKAKGREATETEILREITAIADQFSEPVPFNVKQPGLDQKQESQVTLLANLLKLSFQHSGADIDDKKIISAARYAIQSGQVTFNASEAAPVADRKLFQRILGR